MPTEAYSLICGIQRLFSVDFHTNMREKMMLRSIAGHIIELLLRISPIYAT